MLSFKEFISEGNKHIVAMTQKDLERHVKKLGWSLERNRGDHDVYGHPDATHKLAIPRHRGDIPPGTVRSIVKGSENLDKKSVAA
jgi:predicted RNA binding protein YcfA (HicA-like mRNA interferase family)